MPLRLNVGCGKKLMPHGSEGWENVDVIAYPGVDKVADIRKLPYEDGTVDEVLALDVLEHVLRAEQELALAEFFRVLKPGGVCRGKTPDLRALAEAYVNGGLPVSEFERKIYANQGGGWQGGDVHASGNDAESLREKLVKAGFVVDRITPLEGNDGGNVAWRAHKPEAKA